MNTRSLVIATLCALVVSFAGCIQDAGAAAAQNVATPADSKRVHDLLLAQNARIKALEKRATKQGATIKTLKRQVAALLAASTNQAAAIASVANAATRDQLVVTGSSVGMRKFAFDVEESDVAFTVLGSTSGSFKGATAMEVVSSTGYTADVPVGTSSVAVSEPSQVWYRTADCSGIAYLFTGFSAINAAQGHVFRVGADPEMASYLMVRAGTQAEDLPDLEWRWRAGACEHVGPFPSRTAWASEPNDPQVSGVPSGVFGTSAKLTPEPPVAEPAS